MQPAEAARHGGLVLCCPIAPFAEARATIRALVTAAGAAFILVYMATPLRICEQRDRKGLYVKASSGKLTGMTGIDDPYELPEDADLIIDSSRVSIDEAVRRVLDHLVERAWLDRS